MPAILFSKMSRKQVDSHRVLLNYAISAGFTYKSMDGHYTAESQDIAWLPEKGDVLGIRVA